MKSMRGPFRPRPALAADLLAGGQRLLLLGMVLALALGNLAWQPAAAQTTTWTTTDNLNLRSAPDPEAEVLLVIPVGTAVEVTGEPENGFYPVAWDGLTGYVLVDYLVAGEEPGAAVTESSEVPDETVDEPVATSDWSGPTGTWYVTGGSLNFRSGPGTSYDVIAKLDDGTPLELTGEISGEFTGAVWNDTSGWVATIYLTASAPDVAAEPVVTEEPAATEEVIATEVLPGEATTGEATAESDVPVIDEPSAVGGDGDEAAVQSFSLQAESVGTATVVTGGLTLNLRSGPGTSHGIVGRIPNGATVDVLGAAESGFLPVRYNGTSGYASSDYLRVDSTSTPPTTPTATATPGANPVGSAVVTTQGLNLNLRNGPSTGAAVVGSIPSGATVDVMGAAQAGFLPVRYNGTTGWASSSWLRVSTSPTPTATATPVTPTATPVTPTATATATSTPGTSPVGTAQVITDGLNLNLRNGPSATATIIGRMPPGATVDVMGAAQAGFLPVRYNGTNGWASAEWLSVSASPTPTATATPVTPTPTATPVTPTATATSTPGGPTGTATVNAGGSRLNMRSGPGTQYPVVVSIPDGTVVDVTGAAQNGFLPVRYQGVSGWSSADFLVSGGTTPTPTATVTPTTTVTPTATATSTPGTGVPEIPNAAIGKATMNTTVSLRRGPDTTYGTIQTLNNGWKVEIMGDAYNGWTPIRYNAAKGWVPSSALTAGWGWDILDQMITPVRSIPMMSGPNSGTRVVQVPPGTLVDITGAAQGTWAPARWAHYSGWMDTSLMYQPEDFVEPGPGSQRDAEMIQIIYQAADKWGQSRADMLRVARCESHLDPNIVNPASGTSGLFQFMPSTFAFTPNGKAGANIFDPWQNADAAGWMWANGMRHHWACQ